MCPLLHQYRHINCIVVVCNVGIFVFLSKNYCFRCYRDNCTKMEKINKNQSPKAKNGTVFGSRNTLLDFGSDMHHCNAKSAIIIASKNGQINSWSSHCMYPCSNKIKIIALSFHISAVNSFVHNAHVSLEAKHHCKKL